MFEPRVSVALPVYNGVRYLRESIDSVLGQTFEDFELLICDDCSRDGSLDLIGSYNDSRIRVIRNQSNKGLFATLNVLIGEARGDFIRFWAQDDVMKRHCFATERAFWGVHPEIALSYCARDYIDANGAVIRRFPGDDTPDVIAPWFVDQIAYYYNCLQANISTVCVRRDVLLAAGRFSEDMRFAADFEMWMRISVVHPIGFIRSPIIMLRDHSEQLSRRPAEWPHYMRETRAIFESIYPRLPQEIKPHARAYERRRRATTNSNHVFRMLLSGEFGAARDGFREAAEDGNRAWQTLVWAFTGNGRFFRLEAIYHDPAPVQESLRVISR